MLSIIIPVYNAEQYIERCIGSILEQVENEVEIIAVNDGSKDNSLSVLNRLAEKDSRVRVFDQPNGGVSSARNKGLDEATGEYIMFVDADDYILPNTMKGALGLVAEHPDSDLFVFGVNVISRSKNQGNDCVPPKQMYNGREIIQYIEHKDVISIGSVWAKIFKKSTIINHKLSFKLNQNAFEDIMFNFLFIRHCNEICSTNIVLYCYDVNYQSLTTKFKGQNFLNDLRYFEKVEEDTMDFFAKTYGDSEDIQNINIQYRKTFVFHCLFEIYNLYRNTVEGKKEWLRTLMNEMQRIDANYEQCFTSGVPKLIVKSYSIHPTLAHILLTCIFKAEKVKRKFKSL